MVRNKFLILAAMILLYFPMRSLASVPLLRVKTGLSTISVNAGELYERVALGSMVTFQPSILWDFPSFSSRIGVHYLQELSSPHGMTPMSGIGISAYYHILGISSSYQISDDGVILQKSRPGPYLYAGLTPVNLNMNKLEEGVNSADNKYFSAQCNEIAAGLGYDYPLLQNMLLSGEVVYRTGSSKGTGTSNTSAGSVNYSGYTIFFSLAAAYY